MRFVSLCASKAAVQKNCCSFVTISLYFFMFWHWRLTKLDTSLPHSPSAQLAEAQAEQIVQVLQKRWNGEEPPSEFPPIKLKGILGSLGKKHGFGLLADRPLTGRVPRLLKSGILWMYKYHHGY
ncbi:hypothetical protein AP057_08660 [Geobacillus sp. Sah69]|nr:hypothetical protein AP057_08660 [Geobacillus sp. Sah69]